MAKFKSGKWILLGILLLAAMLRLWGVAWGLPNSTHYFSYHPDEVTVISHVVLNLDLIHGQWLPHFYNYGSLQLYFISIVYTLALVMDWVKPLTGHLARDYPQWAQIYLIGRSITVAMGVGTVWVVAALGTRLWGRRAGLLAALLLALMPLHAQQSHWVTVDVPAAFWGTLSLYWAVRLSTEDPRARRAALLAGLFAGFASATKYNMALCVLPMAMAFGYVARDRREKGIVCLAVGLLAAASAFLLGCPGAVCDSRQFTTDFAFEAHHVRSFPEEAFQQTGNGFLYQIGTNLDAGLGLPLLLLGLVSVTYAVKRRERGDSVIASFALPYYLLISVATVRYARYTMPLLPLLALWIGRLAADCSRLARPVWARLSLQLALVAVVGWTLTDAIVLIRPMAQPDTRDLAAQFIAGALPTNTVSGFPTMPWFQTVPLDPYFSGFRGYWRKMPPHSAFGHFVYTGIDWDISLIDREKPSVIILSQYDKRDALRLHNPRAEAFMAALSKGYHRRQVCQVSPFGAAECIDIATAQGSLDGDRGLPHDMLYPSPTIEIWVAGRQQLRSE